MSLEELKNNLLDGSAICCDTIEERRLATQLLLDMGFLHGGSGYSRRCIDEKCTSDVFMHPAIFDGCIGYYRYRRLPEKHILFSEIEGLLCKDIPAVDDLL